MAIAFLIDGYNLLHAVGLVRRVAAPGELQHARRRLLALLTDGLAPDAGEVVIVFDAHKAPRRGKREATVDGLHIRFAVGDPGADDLIERLIAEHPTPQSLVVVSNDHRLQTAARRRSAQAWTCDALLDRFDKQRQARRESDPPESTDKREQLSPGEIDRWVAEFRDLEDDPAFKRLNDLYRFDD